MAIKLEMLRCFCAVADHGNLQEAALALGRTPSAVSMMLKQFEEHIGAPLFETARKARLTPLGDMIHAQARREVAHFGNTVAVIEGLARSEFGYLRLAVTPSVANTVLPPVLSQFVQTYPQVQIELRDMDSAAIADALQHERADIGIGTLPDLNGLRRVQLFSDPFGVICRKDHLLAQTWTQLTWADMHEHVFIANGLCHLITDPDFAPILAASRLMVPSTSSLLGLVQEGVGITILPRLAFAGQQQQLAFLPLTDASARRRVQMVSRPAALLMPAARAFAALVMELQQSGAWTAQAKLQKS